MPRHALATVCLSGTLPDKLESKKAYTILATEFSAGLISPVEIETLLRKMPTVSDCAVVGVDDAADVVGAEDRRVHRDAHALLLGRVIAADRSVKGGIRQAFTRERKTVIIGVFNGYNMPGDVVRDPLVD